MKNVFLAIGIMMFGGTSALAQSSDIELYIEKYKDMAVDEMDKFGIPASITIAQGILESGSGKSTLASSANNHFGIKCHTSWKGKKIYHDDDKKGECFRVYDNASESFRDHSNFLFHRSRYAGLFELDINDYKGWAKGLKSAGYATNPKYAHLLIDLIERYELDAYDVPGQNMLAENPEEIDNQNSSASSSSDNTLNEAGYPSLALNKEIPTNYNGDIFQLNRIKTVIARDSDNLLSIASRYKIKLHRLRKYNEMNEGEEITSGMYVFLQPKRRKGNQRYHVVKPGESMSDIAQKHGMKVGDLYERNLMKPNHQAMASEILYLRKFREANPKTQSYQAFLRERNELIKRESRAKDLANAEIKEINTAIKSSPPKEIIKEKREPDRATELVSEELIYTVESGDTLYSIARWFKVSVDNIKSWNSLQSDEIDIGQVLIVGK